MVLHTDEQIKAQGELDAVLGSGQLPTLSDRSRLPYVEALYTEVMRTYTFVPLGTHLPDPNSEPPDLDLDFNRASSYRY